MRVPPLLLLLVVLVVVMVSPGARSRRVRDERLQLQRKETSAVDFTRLVAMRLVYGVAKVLGLHEPVSELLNGAFVPPGADDDDDLFDDDDDY